jgi:hypothetical protein
MRNNRHNVPVNGEDELIVILQPLYVIFIEVICILRVRFG